VIAQGRALSDDGVGGHAAGSPAAGGVR
jgi:hypothetical protein